MSTATSVSAVGDDSLKGPRRLTIGHELHDDPDTSMVTSMRLHLISEHFVLDALGMDPADAHAMHIDLHTRTMQAHPVSDTRFRPGRILALLMVGDQLQADDVEADPDDDPDGCLDRAGDEGDEVLEGPVLEPGVGSEEEHWRYETSEAPSEIEDLDDTPTNVPKIPVQAFSVEDIPAAVRFPTQRAEQGKTNPILALWAR